MDQDPQTAADQLYAAAPSAFMATRTALAKAAKASGDAAAAKEIAALRKPSVAAWAINHLLRQRPDVATRLREVGDRLRSAQTRLDAAALKEQRAGRDALLAEVAQAAAGEAEVVGQRLSTAVLTEIHDTVVAALASAEATDAVLSGTLTRALSYSGFGEVDLGDAVARTSTGVRLAVIEGAAPAREAAQVARDRAEGHLRMAARAREAAQARRDAAQQEATLAEERVGVLRDELSAAQAQAETARADLREADDAYRAEVARHAAAEVTLRELKAAAEQE